MLRIVIYSVVACSVLALGVVLFCGVPAYVLALPAAAGAAIVILGNTHWSLCFIAFAITTLGTVRYEIFDVTLYLPEVMILALAAKEGLVFIVRRERFAEGMPVRTIACYVTAAFAALATGFLYRNGLVRILQDFRQFTEFVLLLWLVMQRVRTQRHATQIAFCYVAGATLIAVHTIIQHYMAIGAAGAGISGSLATPRLIRSGSFYHVNSFGALMVLAVGPAAGLALASGKRSVKALMAVCVAVCVIAEVCTKSRGAWLSMLAAFVFIAVAVRPSAKMIAAGAAGAVLIALALGPSIVQRISTLGDPGDDISLLGRARFYTAATHIFRAHPLLGLGWGCYYDIDKIVGEKQYVPTARPAGITEVTVHSLFLQLLVKAGLFGVLAFVGILIVWAERIWRVRRTKPRREEGYALFVGITAGVAGCLFQNIWENFFHQQVIAQSFWLLLGMSILTAGWLGAREPAYKVPVAFVSASAALFLVFVFACLRLEKLDPASCCFENNVAEAMANGNASKALSVARHAVTVNSYDPLAYTVYGRVLLETGDAEAGVEQLKAAISVKRELVGQSWRDTRMPHYFAPARLALGTHCFEQGRSVDAVVNFELARGSADLHDAKFNDFRRVLYDAYAGNGLWGRALEYGEPADDELGGLSDAGIRALAQICEGMENWNLATRLAERIQKRAGLDAEANYLLGRRALGRKEELDTAVECLKKALSAGHPCAAFYLHTSPSGPKSAETIRALAAADAGDPYRTFSLAYAGMLLEGLSENERSSDVPTRQELLEKIDRDLADMEKQARPVLCGKDERFVPVAFETLKTYSASVGFFPVAILWEDRETSSADSEAFFARGSGLKGNPLTLRRGNKILQIRWVRNLVYWEGIENLPPAIDAVAGWVDTARDWFALRAESAAHIQKDDAGDQCLAVTKSTWLYSVPAEVREGKVYLLTGRVKGQPGKGAFVWQFMNEGELVLSEISLPLSMNADAWSSQAAYAPAQSEWKKMQVRLDAMPRAGTVSFDDVMLVEVEQPSVEEWK